MEFIISKSMKKLTFFGNIFFFGGGAILWVILTYTNIVMYCHANHDSKFYTKYDVLLSYHHYSLRKQLIKFVCCFEKDTQDKCTMQLFDSHQAVYQFLNNAIENICPDHYSRSIHNPKKIGGLLLDSDVLKERKWTFEKHKKKYWS